MLQRLVPSPDGPGCAAAVGEWGHVVWEAGRGKADLTTGRSITPQTVFDMASNSKQFTADAVLLLSGRHQLALSEPLSDFTETGLFKAPPENSSAGPTTTAPVASVERNCSQGSRRKR
ncbi:serine hydrolase [Streptomyces sp. NBC_01298]|uniref:serine hydrolase n=1 Tax=Streptomyces sp. NBC_01298 TaxID=2903817 RepID=UPI003FA3D9CD